MNEYRTAVVGTKHYGLAALTAVSRMQPGDAVRVEREPTNKYDQYAVQVHFLGVHVGYVPKLVNRPIAFLLDNDRSVTAVCIGAPEIHGSWIKKEPMILIRADD